MVQERPAPYAASKKQPIFSGCFFEWRLADNIQGAGYGIQYYNYFLNGGVIPGRPSCKQ